MLSLSEKNTPRRNIRSPRIEPPKALEAQCCAFSCVRAPQLGFSDRTYQQLFYVLDVKITRGFDRDLYINLDEQILSLTFALLSSGMQRLIGLVPPELSDRVT